MSAEARSGREPHSWVARLLAWGLLACCAGCAGPERPWVGVVDEGPRAHEAISAATLDEVREGVREFERGDFEAARQTFGRALREAPDDLRVAIWLQDATLVSAEARAVRLGLSTTSTTSPRAQLRRSYRKQAESKPSAFAFLLAARLEDDQRAAELLFERALELEPGLAWAHYGLAHSAARGGDWGRAREELLRTFELDPAHLPALRLFAWAQATAGELDQAILAYEAWLERANEDLLVTESQRHALRLDLALAYLGAGDLSAARELLDSLAGQDVDESRRLAALAAVLQAQGRIAEARAAAVQAAEASPQALLPAVQQALLLELWVKDPWAARAAWSKVAELAAARADLAAGLERFRAQVHLQRLTREVRSEAP